IAQDIEKRLSVTTADVMRVYETYLKGKSYIATSFVPKGQAGLALEGSEVAQVVEEAIVQGAEEQFDASVAAEFERTPSAFDRTVEPPYGAVPQVKVPDVWEQELSNGLALYGVESQEVPLVQFNLVMEGGALMEAAEKSGTANLLAQLMTKGTANRTPAELEAAIQQLGASINIGAGRESITLSATTLKRNYQATLDLAIEMLLQPRWDATEFDLLKQQVQSQYSQQQGNPNAIASNAFNALVYGAEHPRARNLIGDEATLAAITIEDLKGFYQNNLSPSISRMLIVGDITQSEVISSLDGLESQWARQEVDLPEEAQPQAPKQGQVYFYDVPNAKQSVLRIGRPALAATDEDYYPATVMNYILGGGGFASQLTQELRENKGYTYGVRSFFSGTEAVGTFTISSGVRTNITLEATQAVKEILENYGPGFSTQDLETTKGFLIKSNARAFETAGAKLRMLSEISAYGRPYDYVKDQEQIVQEITQERIRELAAKYVNPDEMIWLVVGDAKTQLPRMRELGYGEPILINVESEMQ
ncbi:MAG: pitrilysin family protein, partial [Bacteroidota bacterium]